MAAPTTNDEIGAPPHHTSSWLVFLALYIALTVWIFVGRELVSEPIFAWVKNGGYAIVMLVGAWGLRDGYARSWRTTKQHPRLAAGAVLLGLALMGVASAVSHLATLCVAAPSAGGNQAAISAEMLAASTSFLGGLVFVGIGGFAAPVVEELLFRELPFARLRRLLSTPTAFVLSCLVFGAVHLRGLHEWPLAIMYVGFAAALATAYLISKRNLLVSISTHVLWNGSGLTYVILTAA